MKNLNELTLSTRHWLVKNAARLLVPKLYHDLYEFDIIAPRPMIKFIHKKFGNTSLVGAEIGVGEGNHAANILKVLNIQKLFLIDPFISYEENGKPVEIPYENLYVAQTKLKKYVFKTKFIEAFSTEAARIIPDDSLDFCYIDGNHQYENVKADIETYYPKMKIGGVIGGHDFITFSQGVIFAATEFAKTNNLLLHISYPDWWVVKE